MHNDDARRSLFTIFQAALQAVNGHVVVHDWLHRHPMTGPVYLLAVGKAACAMARGAHATLGNQIADALLITKHGYAEWLPWPVHEAGHPRPDDASLEAGVQLQAFISAIPSNAQVLVLLSGGASALVEALPPGMTLGDLQSLNDWLLGSGLDIHSLNLLRKRLSCIKGGRLAQQLAPRRVLCLAISDVPGGSLCKPCCNCRRRRRVQKTRASTPFASKSLPRCAARWTRRLKQRVQWG